MREAGNAARFIKARFALAPRFEGMKFVYERNSGLWDRYLVLSAVFGECAGNGQCSVVEPFFLNCGGLAKALAHEYEKADGRPVYVVSCGVPYFAQLIVGKNTGSGNVTR